MAAKSAPLSVAPAKRAGLLDADPGFKYLPTLPAIPSTTMRPSRAAHGPVWLSGTDNLDVVIFGAVRSVEGNISTNRWPLAN